MGGLSTQRNALASFYTLNTGATPNYSSKWYTEVVNPALSSMRRGGHLWPSWRRRVVVMLQEPENCLFEVAREACR